MSTDQLIAFWAAVGQVGAAILALAALFMSLRTARKQIEAADRAAKEHAALLFEQVRSQRDSDILRWTEQTIDLLSDADSFISEQGAAAYDDLAISRQRRILARLSALIDHGRMYFPNQTPEKQGADKPIAYQGFRQRILSVLVFAYDAIAKAHNNNGAAASKALCETLLDLRRKFVSEAQVAIDPRRFIALREMNEIRTERGLPQQTAQEMEWASSNGSGPPR